MEWDTDSVDDVDTRVGVRGSDDGREADAVSIRIVESVAEATGRRVTDLAPLYDVIDPDALDDLFAPRAAASVASRSASRGRSSRSAATATSSPSPPRPTTNPVLAAADSQRRSVLLIPDLPRLESS